MAATERSLLGRIDDAIFAVERALVVTMLGAMAVLVFFDVVYRRLISPDSAFASFLLGIPRRFGVVLGEGARAFVERRLTPFLLAVLAYFLIALASVTLRRGPSTRGRWWDFAVVAPVGLVALYALGLAMVEVPSRYFYLLLYGIGALAFAAVTLRRRGPGWLTRLIGVAIATPFVVLFSRQYVPEGFAWSREVSMILLLWVGFLGASMCAHQGKHLRLEAGERLIPVRWRHPARGISHIVTALFCVFYVAVGYVYLFARPNGFYFRGTAFELTGIPDWTCAVVIPISFAVMAARFAGAAVTTLRSPAP